MVFKYFVAFDANGEMRCFCKSKRKCEEKHKEKCKEYIIKLSVIDRNKESEISISNLDISKINKLGSSMNKFSKDTKVFNSGVDAVSRNIRKVSKVIKGIKI